MFSFRANTLLILLLFGGFWVWGFAASNSVTAGAITPAQNGRSTAALQLADIQYYPPNLADNGYMDVYEAMAPPIQREDKLMVRWPGLIYANAVVVLMYHDVAPFVPPALPATISTKQMKDHLKYLYDAGYNVISQRQFEEFVLHGTPVPHNAVLITFDDGYRTFWSFVYPLLQEMDMPATSFIILANTEHINTSSHRPTLEWEQIAEMEKSGLVTIEPHAYNGHKYVRIIPSRQQQRPWYLAKIYAPGSRALENDSAYLARITRDFYLARTTIEKKIGGQRISFAYPYGARNDYSDAAAHAAGLQVLFTVRAGIVTRQSDSNMLPRVNGGSPAVTVKKLDEAIRKVVMGKRYTQFDLPAIRDLQRGARMLKLENCCRTGPLPE